MPPQKGQQRAPPKLSPAEQKALHPNTGKRWTNKEVAFVVKSKNDGHEHSVAEKILLRSNMSIRIKYHKRMKEIKAEEKAMARAAKRKYPAVIKIPARRADCADCAMPSQPVAGSIQPPPVSKAVFQSLREYVFPSTPTRTGSGARVAPATTREATVPLASTAEVDDEETVAGNDAEVDDEETTAGSDAGEEEDDDEEVTDAPACPPWCPGPARTPYAYHAAPSTAAAQTAHASHAGPSTTAASSAPAAAPPSYTYGGGYGTYGLGNASQAGPSTTAARSAPAAAPPSYTYGSGTNSYGLANVVSVWDRRTILNPRPHYCECPANGACRCG